MTTWIGLPGSMRPTGGVTEIPVQHEERTIFSGGTGTLSARRVLHSHTGSARSWRAAVDIDDTNEISSITQLAHAQRVTGQAWRVLPSDSIDTNVLTEHATESCAGWSAPGGAELNLLAITQEAYEMEYVTRRVKAPEGMISVLEDGVTLEEGVILGPAGPGEWYEVTDEIERVVYPSLGVRHNHPVYTPLAPFIGDAPRTVYIGAFHTGTAVVRARAFNNAGTLLWSNSVESVHGPDLRRTQRAFEISNAAATYMDVAIVPEGLITSCWPSIQFGTRPHRYTPGRGCDEAWLSVPDSNPGMTTPDQHFASWDYTITEIGV